MLFSTSMPFLMKTKKHVLILTTITSQYKLPIRQFYFYFIGNFIIHFIDWPFRCYFRFPWAITEVLVLQITLVVHPPLLFLTVFPPPVLQVLVQIRHWVITPLMIPQTITFNSSISRQVHSSINLNNSRWWVTSNCVNASSW